MQVTKLLWGIVIYAVMHLASTALVQYGIVEGYAPRLIGFLVLLCVTWAASRALSERHPLDVLPYSIGWAVIVVLLDAVFAVPYTGWILYQDWNVWVGYALVVVMPPLMKASRDRANA